MNNSFLKIPVFKIKVMRRKFNKIYFASNRTFIQNERNKLLDSKTRRDKEEHWQKAPCFHKKFYLT